MSKANSERDAHRVFRRRGLAFKIPIAVCDIPEVPGYLPLEVEYIRVQDYFRYLLLRYPKLLFGGSDDPSALCESFWLEAWQALSKHKLCDCILRHLRNTSESNHSIRFTNASPKTSGRRSCRFACMETKAERYERVQFFVSAGSLSLACHRNVGENHVTHAVASLIQSSIGHVSSE